jgi:hypothetical protein
MPGALSKPREVEIWVMERWERRIREREEI